MGDVVVRPEGADGLTGSTRTIPDSLVRKLEKVEGVARVDGNVTSSSVMIIGADGKALGGLGAPGLAGTGPTPPPGTAWPGWRSSPAGSPRDRGRS